MSVLSLALGHRVNQADESDKPDKRRYLEDNQGTVKFTSQRAQYLRVALEAEKEIARLRGLYGVAIQEVDATVVFRVERVEPALPPLPQAVVVEAGPEVGI